MEYLAKLIGLDELLRTRESQFVKQVEHDRKFRDLGKSCPETVMDYLLLARQRNRGQTETISSGGMLKYLQNTRSSIKEITEYQKELDKVLKSNCPCKLLLEYNLKATIDLYFPD